MSETDKAVAEVIRSAGDVAPELWVSLVGAERLQSSAAVMFFFLLALGLAYAARLCWEQHNKGDLGFLSGCLAVLSLAVSTFWIDDAIYPEAAVVRSVLAASR